MRYLDVFFFNWFYQLYGARRCGGVDPVRARQESFNLFN